MKKLNASKMCYLLSCILFLIFIVKSVVDYTQYSTTLNSAPFYVWIVMNALYFVIPAVVVLIIGTVIQKQTKKE